MEIAVDFVEFFFKVVFVVLRIWAAVVLIVNFLSACGDMNGITTESIYIGKYQFHVKQKLYEQQGQEWVNVDSVQLANTNELGIKLDVTLEIKDGSDKYKITNPIITRYESSAGGKIEMLGNGMFTYTSPSDFVGIDEITYYIQDSHGGNPKGFIRISIGQNGETSNTKNISVVGLQQGQSSSFNVLETEGNVGQGIQDVVAGDAATPAKAIEKIEIIDPPKYGKVEFDVTGDFTYTPFPDHFGSDEFTYTIFYTNGEEENSTIRLTVDCSEVVCKREFFLSWDSSESENVTQYRVYAGRQLGAFNSVFNVGPNLDYQYIAREKGRYYFAVTAVNDQGIESPLSQVQQALF